MEKRSSRVSEAQWAILLEFLESNPNLARSKGFNNTAQGRSQASKLWQEVTNLLNAEGSGVTKAPKDWAIPSSASVNREEEGAQVIYDLEVDPPTASVDNLPEDVTEAPLTMPIRSRRRRSVNRHRLGPLEEAQRILAQIERQRLESDAARARALDLIGQNLGRLADYFQQFVDHLMTGSR